MKPSLITQPARDQSYYDQAALYISAALLYSTSHNLLNSLSEKDKIGLSDYYETRCMKCLYLITLFMQPER
jgi:hypothetical protein